VLLAVDPAKDVDGFHPLNVGRLASVAPGDPLDFPVPCTPLGVSMLLHDVLGSLAGRRAMVIGRSNLVGRPVAQLLLRADCTVTIAHSRTRDMPALSRQADILVVAIGKADFVRGDWIKPGATVIDVGIGKSRLVGDVAFAEALPVAGYLTPVPGGVGPMTVACLMFNTLQAARRASGLAVTAAD
jgi:methylenetetrahydrofolate dehydrogenase (NADP+)/methenyltetrahydrofolate cyclohydrolase